MAPIKGKPPAFPDSGRMTVDQQAVLVDRHAPRALGLGCSPNRQRDAHQAERASDDKGAGDLLSWGPKAQIILSCSGEASLGQTSSRLARAVRSRSGAGWRRSCSGRPVPGCRRQRRRWRCSRSRSASPCQPSSKVSNQSIARIFGKAVGISASASLIQLAFEPLFFGRRPSRRSPQWLAGRDRVSVISWYVES